MESAKSGRKKSAHSPKFLLSWVAKGGGGGAGYIYNEHEDQSQVCFQEAIH